jgi:dihydroxyacid dehydratase/phosphogluconate dehydratase
MTIDEAAAIVADIPEVKAIEVVSLKPGDVVVLSYDGPISSEMCERLKSMVWKVWPDHQVIVLTDGLEMRIVRDHEA